MNRIASLTSIGLILAAACIVALLSVGFMVFTPSNDGNEPHHPTQNLSGDFHSELIFESLDQMTATADLIVVGTITDVQPGKVTTVTYDTSSNYPEGSNAINSQENTAPSDEGVEVEEVRDLDTTVKIDEALKGTTPNGITVSSLEDAYSGPRSTDWRESGQRVLLFLSRSTETPGTYIPARASYEQAVYLIEGDALVATTEHHAEEPVQNKVTTLSLSALRLDIENIKEKVASGKVEPLALER